MSDIEYGVVKFFKDDKKFGFVTVLDAEGNPTSEELFFHYSNGHFMRAGTSEPQFWLETGTMHEGKVRDIPVPAKGTKLVFTRGRNDKGEKVALWGYASQFDSLVKTITNRPVYRVVRSGRNYGQDASGTVWEGQDIIDLSARYPKRPHSKDPRGTRDTLGAGSADSGDMHWHYRFEQQIADGTWKTCTDPRVENCCVPRPLLKRHNPGYYQDNCYHGKR